MREMSDNLDSRNPLSRVQCEIAEILRTSELFEKYRVEVIEQNSQAMSFLLQRSISQVNNVIIIVGVDEMTNNPPVLEAVTTISATENVIMNRQAADSITALDAIQEAIRLVDGQAWKFEDMQHEAPTQGALKATATFRGQITRELI